MIELALWQQLDAVARCGTLSAAARELGISQPALTKSMRRLEARLGATLFTRSRATRIALNETGQLAAEGAHDLLIRQERLMSEIRRLSLQERSLRIGSEDAALGARLLPTLQDRFRSTPLCFVPVTANRIPDGILAHTLDLGILSHSIVSDLLAVERCSGQNGDSFLICRMEERELLLR